MAKSKEKIKARRLRKEGESIKEIAKMLSVSSSSVSLWCRDVELSANQKQKLKDRQVNPTYWKRQEYYSKKKREFDKKVFKIKQEGIKSIGKLSKRDIFLIGIALYWGEGFKKDHLVGLASSDVNIAKFFIYWLKLCFNIPQDQLILRLTANISYKEKIDAMNKHWSSSLNIPLHQFSKPFFQHTRWQKEYENKNDYYGVLRVRVRRSVNLLRKIYGFIEGVSLNIKV